MKRGDILAVVLMVVLGAAAAWSPAEAQFGKLKDKVKQKAEEKANQKVDEAIDGTKDQPAETEEASGETGEIASAPATDAGGTAASESMALYTKYDFVPGDKVIFYDDLAREEMGEFPSRWRLDSGVFEVVRQGDLNYILCTDEGMIRPKVTTGPLPPRYTVEMDFYSKGPERKGHWFHIQWIDAEDQPLAYLSLTDGRHTKLTVGTNILASKELPAVLSAGTHTMRVMATSTTLKCYIDHERVANVPALENFAPVGFRVHLDPWMDEADNPMIVRNFRYAEGGKTLRQQLDEAGKIVTHGILFDSGSSRIKAESYKTLADLGQLLTDDGALRLSIEGHTDSDGADEANLKLSQDRASSVRAYLMETCKVDGARLEAKGFGESKPIDTNDTPEGKANNRRVELVKL